MFVVDHHAVSLTTHTDNKVDHNYYLASNFLYGLFEKNPCRKHGKCELMAILKKSLYFDVILIVKSYNSYILCHNFSSILRFNAMLL